MAWSFISAIGNDFNVQSAPTRAFSSPITQGDLLIVIVEWQTAQTFNGLSDTLSNIWNQLGTNSVDTNNSTSAIFWAKANASGADTVTANFSANTSGTVTVADYGAPSSWAFDAQATPFKYAAASGTSISVGPVTTTANGDLILALIAQEGARSFTDGATPAFTVRLGGNARGHVIDLIAANPAGPYSDNGTLGGTTFGTFYLVSFKDTSSKGGIGSLGLGIGLGPGSKYNVKNEYW